MNKQRLAAAAAALIAWGCLTGLALIRLWAVLYGALSGPALMALAALLAAAALALAIKLRLFHRWLLPFGRSWKTALLAVAAFALGVAFDISYDLFYVGEYTVGALPFRLASAAGSGQFHIICPIDRYISGTRKQRDAISLRRIFGVSVSFRKSSSAAAAAPPAREFTPEAAPAAPFTEAP